MLKREISYLKHIFFMAVNNPLRFWLSALGFFIAMFVFSTGNILINSYYDSEFEAQKEMDDTSVLVTTRYETEELGNQLKKLDNENCMYIKAGEDKEVIRIEEKGNEGKEIRMVFSAAVLGVSKNLDGVLPVKYSDMEYAQSKLSLIKGRYINIQDVSEQSNVVVIDELTERILFGEEDGIGKEIKLNANFFGTYTIAENGNAVETEKSVSLKVIGVVENSYHSKNQEMLYEKYLKEGTKDTYVETVMYCPVSIEYFQKEAAEENYYMWSYEEKEDYDNTLNRLNALAVYFEGKSVEIDIFDKEVIKLRIEEAVKTLKLLMYSVIVTLVVIAGVSTMNIMFFSIKERINEIGIKKALGATKLDIVVQFILEGQIIGVFAGGIAVLSSIGVARILEYYINNKMYIYFRINIGMNEIWLPMCLAVIFSFAFSLLPSIYGANINVTKALRFE